MDVLSDEADDPQAGHFSVPAKLLFAECERLAQQAAAAVTDDNSLREVAGDVGGVLLRMADNPELLYILAPAEASTPSALLTRRDLLRLPWEDYLSRAGYEGPPPAKDLAEQLVRAVTGKPPGLPPTRVEDLQYLLRRLGTELALDAADDAPGSRRAILHRIGVALWTIARVAFAAAFAAIVSGLLPGLAPAAPVIAVVVHQVAPEVAKAVAEQVMPDLARRPARSAGNADPDSVGILLAAPGGAGALLVRWRDVDGPVDRDLVTKTQRWCDVVQGALFVERYHERVRGGDSVHAAADAIWRLQRCLGDAIDRNAVADTLDQARRVLEDRADPHPARPPEVDTARHQPPAPPTPQVAGAASVEDVHTRLSGCATDLEKVMGLLAHAGRDLTAIRDEAHATLEGSGNQHATAAVNGMTSMADALGTMTAGLQNVVDELGAYDLEIGGSAESQPTTVPDVQVQRRSRRLSLGPPVSVETPHPNPAEPPGILIGRLRELESIEKIDLSIELGISDQEPGGPEPPGPGDSVIPGGPAG